MPKEYIHCKDFAQRFKDEEGHTLDFVDHSSAKVSWSRESENVSLVVVDAAKDPDGMDQTLKYLNLSRAGCNHLIQTLRRARDSAFGADA